MHLVGFIRESIGDVDLRDYKEHKTQPRVTSSQIQPRSRTKFNASQFAAMLLNCVGVSCKF